MPRETISIATCGRLSSHNTGTIPIVQHHLSEFLSHRFQLLGRPVRPIGRRDRHGDVAGYLVRDQMETFDEEEEALICSHIAKKSDVETRVARHLPLRRGEPGEVIGAYVGHIDYVTWDAIVDEDSFRSFRYCEDSVEYTMQKADIPHPVLGGGEG